MPWRVNLTMQHSAQRRTPFETACRQKCSKAHYKMEVRGDTGWGNRSLTVYKTVLRVLTFIEWFYLTSVSDYDRKRWPLFIFIWEEERLSTHACHFNPNVTIYWPYWPHSSLEVAFSLMISDTRPEPSPQLVLVVAQVKWMWNEKA